MISLDVARRLAQALRPSTPDVAETSGGVVTRLDNDGTVWVQLHGADEDTPCTSQTAAVRVGDAVTVTIDGGSARVDGNVTRPATDDERAEEAHELAAQAVDEVAEVRETATATARLTAIANGIAEEAQAVASAINQHFWADGNGVHVTEAEGDPTTEHNILINSLGILLRKAASPLVSITEGAIAFYDGAGSAASNIVASFGSNGAQVGKASANHLSIGSSGVEILDGNTSRAFFGSTARIGPTTAPHVSVNITGMKVYSDASNLVAELKAVGDVAYLLLGDNNRQVSATESVSSGVTKDILQLYASGADSSHTAGIYLIADGADGHATFRVHDDSSEGGNNAVDVTPNKLVAGYSVLAILRGGAQITNGATINGGLTLGTPLPVASGGTGITDYGNVLTDDISSSYSVASDSWKSIGSVTLQPGTWLLTYDANFAENATGRRNMCVHTSADTANTSALRTSGTNCMAVSGAMTCLNASVITIITNNPATYYLNVLQASGASLGVTGRIRAFRLK